MYQTEIEKPVVSVIIANYNRADLLKLAIQSVVDQTFENYEIIIVDDGSQDHSLEVIEAFRTRFPDKIRLFQHHDGANKGIVATYRMAIDKSRGEIIGFLEHDDTWSPDYLQNKVDILTEHKNVGVAFSPYRVVSDGWFGRDMMLRQWLLKSTIKKGKPFDNFPNLLRSNNVATFSCFLTRKALLVELPSPPGHILAFDWWVLTQLSMKSLFYYDETGLTYWRWSRQSAIGRQEFGEHKKRGCNFMELMYQQVEKTTSMLPADKQDTFHENQEDFRYFVDFYRSPKIASFWSLFRRSPIWALAAAMSLLINFLKFR